MAKARAKAQRNPALENDEMYRKGQLQVLEMGDHVADRVIVVVESGMRRIRALGFEEG